MQWFTTALQVWGTANTTNTIASLQGVGSGGSRTAHEVRGC